MGLKGKKHWRDGEGCYNERDHLPRKCNNHELVCTLQNSHDTSCKKVIELQGEIGKCAHRCLTL